jgi:hypothetical protein
MTKKDFELIAGVISQFTGEGKFMVSPALIAGELASALAGELATALAGTNKRFHREIFLTACGVK